MLNDFEKVVRRDRRATANTPITSLLHTVHHARLPAAQRAFVLELLDQALHADQTAQRRGTDALIGPRLLCDAASLPSTPDPAARLLRQLGTELIRPHQKWTTV